MQTIWELTYFIETSFSQSRRSNLAPQGHRFFIEIRFNILHMSRHKFKIKNMFLIRMTFVISEEQLHWKLERYNGEQMTQKRKHILVRMQRETRMKIIVIENAVAHLTEKETETHTKTKKTKKPQFSQITGTLGTLKKGDKCPRHTFHSRQLPIVISKKQNQNKPSDWFLSRSLIESESIGPRSNNALRCDCDGLRILRWKNVICRPLWIYSVEYRTKGCY